MTKPSIYIEATGKGLHWKVVHEGETLGDGTAQSMKDAQSAADAVVAVKLPVHEKQGALK